MEKSDWIYKEEHYMRLLKPFSLRLTPVLILITGVLLVTLIGCTNQKMETCFSAPLTSPVEENTAGELPQTPDGEILPGEDDHHSQEVILRICDRNETESEYILTEEHGQNIIELFYNHEIEILDSPLKSDTPIVFNIGNDHFGTSIESLGLFGVLDGIIGKKCL